MSKNQIMRFMIDGEELTEEKMKFLQYRLFAKVRDLGYDPSDKNTERTDGRVPSLPPQSKDDWLDFYGLSGPEWVQRGMIRWDGTLYLFPKEWFDFIPSGMPLMTVADTLTNFSKEKRNKHYVEGALGFGLVNLQEITKEIAEELQASTPAAAGV